ncbi:dTMP kinase [candidate division WOR-1 bacterium RIFOXYA12_FULL_52_29]|uniref:Thymidylate kinase n=1 Tax=candidate division WOR-1 bacterium RIFOXYC12_FULL_54_18 TaxID=1802584 RepID=A0A1F4T580_UNCSA|nr:MAG: dTMP kinase [candidate division WOR-1 bacterium RIFOXYA2_FULL_51_19]OGC17283.1 MAG: dTMP kinase [candidate division WOR-1 bacterium RIFOXYA12_FULL_52_29]OGC26143.1 MAG: dTMP kinase [candidate division WOR-1 bacterium RIFOXYB2_FULL_45_9]OGC27700.1 MAG: dTMP kinase [candidate division WOR-1 bacterium RIFOXYC12_FULL_54_18]OGC30009.1 MAG: dTMP kinase [candidate division WOR-1 bacterium RIFOXYB12_FULL_52_16]
MFITFEGPEGCGKSTHSQLLKTYLENKGLVVVQTREPGGTPLGVKLRAILLEKSGPIDQLAEASLFFADRAEHVAGVILPALKSGKCVICDRFLDSTLAYQIGGRGLPEDLIRFMNMEASFGVRPDLTFLLDIPPEVGLERAKNKGAADRFEREGMAFHTRVREKYLALAADDPERIKLFPFENLPIDLVQTKIRSIVDEKFGN